MGHSTRHLSLSLKVKAMTTKEIQDMTHCRKSVLVSNKSCHGKQNGGWSVEDTKTTIIKKQLIQCMHKKEILVQGWRTVIKNT